MLIFFGINKLGTKLNGNLTIQLSKNSGLGCQRI